MRIQISSLILFLAAAAACSEPTSAPADEDAGLSLTASANGTAVDRGDGVFAVVNDVLYLDCVGEEVRFNATVPFRWTLATTPSGHTNYMATFIPHTQSGVAVGQTSGRVWTLNHVISPQGTRSTASTTVLTFTALQMWVTDGGPTMQLHTLFRVSQRADGTTVVDKFEFRCNTI